MAPTGPQPVKRFQLIDGKQHMHDGVSLKTGDIVLLNQNQAVAFKDKLAPLDPAEKFKIMSPEEEKKFVESEANRRNARDAKAGTADAEHYET